MLFPTELFLQLRAQVSYLVAVLRRPEDYSIRHTSLPEVRLELLGRSCRESHVQDDLKANEFGVFLTVVCEPCGKQSRLPAMGPRGTKPKARNGPD